MSYLSTVGEILHFENPVSVTDKLDPEMQSTLPWNCFHWDIPLRPPLSVYVHLISWLQGALIPAYAAANGYHWIRRERRGPTDRPIDPKKSHTVSEWKKAVQGYLCEWMTNGNPEKTARIRGDTSLIIDVEWHPVLSFGSLPRGGERSKEISTTERERERERESRADERGREGGG